MDSVPSTQAWAGPDFIPPCGTPMTTSRALPCATIQAWRTKARSRQVGFRRERAAITPIPAFGPNLGGGGTGARTPTFAKRFRTVRAAKVAHKAPSRTEGRSLHMVRGTLPAVVWKWRTWERCRALRGTILQRNEC